MRVLKILPVVISLLIIIVCIASMPVRYAGVDPRSPSLTPWASIGGCGAGGGAAGGSSAMWLGNGVSGNLLDIEARVNHSSTNVAGGGMGLLRSSSFPLTLNWHPGPIDLSLSVPFVSKTILFDSEKLSVMSGGISDISITLADRLGSQGNLGISFTVSIPTGNYEVYDLAHKLLPSSGQIGSGLYSGTLGLDLTTDREWGLTIFGLSYSAGLFAYDHKNKWDKELERPAASSKSLVFARRGSFFAKSQSDSAIPERIALIGAVNGIGVISSDNLDLHGYLGFKREGVMHSLGIKAAIPMGQSAHTVFTYASNPDRISKSDVPTSDSLIVYLKKLVSNGEDGGVAGEPVFHFEPQVTYGGVDAGDEWVIERREVRLDKQWIRLTASYGMEMAPDWRYPVFCAISVPFEFNLDDGAGFNGFTAELGLKLGLF